MSANVKSNIGLVVTAIGVFVGVSTVVGTLVMAGAERAAAKETKPLDNRVTALEVQQANTKEQNKELKEGMLRIEAKVDTLLINEKRESAHKEK